MDEGRLNNYAPWRSSALLVMLDLLNGIKQYSALLDQIEKQPLTYEEKKMAKRMNELIHIQFDDLDWRVKHPSVRAFMLRHLWLRHLWFGQILTPQESAQIAQEVDTLIQQLPLVQ